MEVTIPLADQASIDILSAMMAHRATGKAVVVRMSAYRQYFHPIAGCKQNDVVIDGGAYTGDTARLFAPLASVVYSFEPATDNFAKLKDAAASLPNVVCINKALWSSDVSKLSLVTKDRPDYGYQTSVESGDYPVECTSIDAFVALLGISPSFIKLDIEGSEIAALNGATNTLAHFKPRLAVAIYHWGWHLAVIPAMVKHINPDYNMWIGHHSMTSDETILYAA